MGWKETFPRPIVGAFVKFEATMLRGPSPPTVDAGNRGMELPGESIEVRKGLKVSIDKSIWTKPGQRVFLSVDADGKLTVGIEDNKINQ